MSKRLAISPVHGEKLVQLGSGSPIQTQEFRISQFNRSNQIYWKQSSMISVTKKQRWSWYCKVPLIQAAYPSEECNVFSSLWLLGFGKKMDKWIVWIHKSGVNFNKYFGVVSKAVPMQPAKDGQGSFSALKASWHGMEPVHRPKLSCPLKTEMPGCFGARDPGRNWAGEWSVATPTCTGRKPARVCSLFHRICEPGCELCPLCFLFIRIDLVKRFYPAKI